jgi:shikimate kinase
MPGVGKSTITAALAASGKLYHDLLVEDLDHLIEDEQGIPITEIFEEKGESSFRNIEARKLREFSGLSQNFILATGGGTPCFRRNMAFMKQQGMTIYLKLAPAIIADRIYEKGVLDRPLLSHLKAKEGLVKRLENKLTKREKFYSRADHTIELANLSIQDTTGLILNLVQKVFLN